MSKRALLSVVLLASALAGCGRERNSEIFVGPITLNAQQQRGELVFFRNCNECHPQGESGLGPALNDKELPGWFIKNQVRRPILIMPAFSEAQISDEDLDALVEYLKVVRNAEEDAIVPPITVPGGQGGGAGQGG